MAEAEEEDAGQELFFPPETTEIQQQQQPNNIVQEADVIEIIDDDNVDSEYYSDGDDITDNEEDNDDEFIDKQLAKGTEESKIVNGKEVLIKTGKGGKTIMVFSELKRDLDKAAAEKLRAKLVKTKEVQLCDFKVKRKRKKQC